MTFADLSVLVVQVALPVALLAWLFFAPASNRLLYLGQVTIIVLCAVAMILVPVWLTLPWWLPWIYLLTCVAAAIVQLIRTPLPTRPGSPRTLSGRLVAASFALVAIGVLALIAQALAGRTLPNDSVDLAFPLGPGRYLVANGGAAQIVNAHFLTLDPKTDRQRAYRGQSYAVDLVKVDRFGFRASGWRPREPRSYEIFGEPVHAPCTGTVLSARGDMPDMSVPEMDRSLLEGNHVFIDCGDFGVLLAHLRKNSVVVVQGKRIEAGDPLGEAGNSGQTGEPHLHIHAQRLPANGPLLSGEPVFLTLGGHFPVRNERIVIR